MVKGRRTMVVMTVGQLIEELNNYPKDMAILADTGTRYPKSILVGRGIGSVSQMTFVENGEPCVVLQALHIFWDVNENG